MTYMKGVIDFSTLSDQAALQEIGDRVRQNRLNQNVTQAGLAKKAGTSRSVVQNIESGQDTTMSSMVRVLRALEMLDQLNVFLPPPGISPVQLARLEGHQRQRASGARARTRGSHEKERP